MKDLHDGSRRLNLRVLLGLNAREIVVDRRATGKTITMLTHIAVRQEFSGFRLRPIIVCPKADHAYVVRDLYRESFHGFPEPRCVSETSFMRERGWYGPVYLDEPALFKVFSDLGRWNELMHHATRYGFFAGGVSSYFLR